MRIRAPERADLPALEDLWRRSVPHDAVDREALEQLIGGESGAVCLLAEAEPSAGAASSPAAFAAAAESNPDVSAAIIPLLLSEPTDAGAAGGSMLLEAMEEQMRGRGARRIIVGDGPSGAFSDGIDERDAHLLHLLESRGYKPQHASGDGTGDVHCSLSRYVFAADIRQRRNELIGEGLLFKFAHPPLRAAYLEFVERYFASEPRWREETRRYIESNDSSRLRLLAVRGSEVVAFTRFELPADDAPCIWATAVHPELRHRGIGTVLVALALAELHRLQFPEAIIRNCPLRFAERFGQVARRLIRFEKELR